MTDEQARALGERWIKAGGGWRPGMCGVGEWVGRCLHASTGCLVFAEEKMGIYVDASAQIFPDLRDPATRGAALEVVRERWGDPELCIRRYREAGLPEHQWITASCARRKPGIVGGPTEAEALVAALETTP